MKFLQEKKEGMALHHNFFSLQWMMEVFNTNILNSMRFIRKKEKYENYGT